jgi:hypothetical protein
MIDFPGLIESVANKLLGEPNPDLSTKDVLRWGNKGSLAIDLKKGTWFDHEHEQGGGVLALIKREREGDPFEWLRAEGLIPDDTIIATFDYRDEQNRLLFQVCRTVGKRFWQRRPNGRDRWINNLKDTRRVLYRLPELINSTGVVFIPEGEKHVDRLRDLGLVATCNPGGAATSKKKSKWHDCYNEFLRNRDVVILPDNDDVGQKHADNIARNLASIASKVRVLMLPDLGPKGDVIDWLAAGGTVEKLSQLAEATPTFGAPTTPTAPTLSELTTEAKLFHTSDHRGYANITNGDHRETWPIRSKNFKLWLTRSWFLTTGKPPSREALNSNLDQIEAEALFDGPVQSVFIRVGAAQGKLYLDLCDDKWRVIEIDPAGWRVISNPPIYFRRTPGMEPQPVPLTGGSIDLLRPFLNLPKDDEDDDGFVLTIAWLLAAFRECGPYPLLVLSGEQGTAKTFFCKLMRMLIDPNSTPNRTLPREERDLYITANNSHILAFDNVSGMPHWISDALCRLSTGGGLGVRQLYTDEDETLFNVTRPIILNGIEDNMTRPDLADRAITLMLETIPEEERRAEKDLLADFEKQRPKILGALLTLVVTGLRNLPDTKLDKLPRMADFALWIEACEPWECGTFEKAYTTNRDNMVEVVMEANPLAEALRNFIIERGEWKGGATKLLEELNRRDTEDRVRRDRRRWPQTSNHLSGGVRRAAPLLRKLGFTITVDREPTGERFVELKSNRPAQPRPEPPF